MLELALLPLLLLLLLQVCMLQAYIDIPPCLLQQVYCSCQTLYAELLCGYGMSACAVYTLSILHMLLACFVLYVADPMSWKGRKAK